MMTIIRVEKDFKPVLIVAGIDDDGALVLSHGDRLLGSDDVLFAELPKDPEGSSNPDNFAEFVVPDFEHSGVLYEVHVWELHPDGSLPWERSDGAARSGTRSDLDTIPVIVVTAERGLEVDAPSDTSGPPAPGTTKSTVKVKVKKQGSMPF